MTGDREKAWEAFWTRRWFQPNDAGLESHRASFDAGWGAALAQRMVTTVKDLQALPHGSYVRGNDGFGHVKHLDHWILTAGTGHPHPVTGIELPARILFTPGGEQDA